MAQTSPFTFIALADTHIRPEEDAGPWPFASSRLTNARNRCAVALINRLSPEFVVHLGDLSHPLPVLPGYDESIEAVAAILGQIECKCHLVAGNHDMGDKPGAWAGAPEVCEETLNICESKWGESYGAFDHDDCHFVHINAMIMNSELPAQAIQRAWLGDDLTQARADGKRIFLLSHYPVFLTDPREPDHYDNISAPARSWLLELIQENEVEAVFAGHGHHFFYNRYGETRMYVVPSVAFVRPDLSEMFRVDPAAEFGRNDLPKLGFLRVNVDADGHSIEFVRTGGATDPETLPPASISPRSPQVRTERRATPVGVYMRCAWADAVEMPYGNLDEFSRKRVRNDYPLLALWEAGIRRLRVPMADLVDRTTRARMEALVEEGCRFTVFGAGVPGRAEKEAVRRWGKLVDSWEICPTWETMTDAIEVAAEIKKETPVRLALSKIETLEEIQSRGGRFSHFVRHGFQSGDGKLLGACLAGCDGADAVERIVFRLGPGMAPYDGIRDAAAEAAEFGARASVHVQLQGPSQAAANRDDAAIASRVAEAMAAALATGGAIVFFDSLVDHDRGYYPRHGLVDRRGNPRRAWHVLRNLSLVLPRRWDEMDLTRLVTQPGIRAFVLEDAQRASVLLLPEAQWPGGDVGPLPVPGPEGPEGIGTYTHLATGLAEPVDWRRAPGAAAGMVLHVPGSATGPILFVPTG